MFLLRATEDQNVVEEYQDPLVEHVAEGVVHQLHECAWRVAQAHRQNTILVTAVSRTKSGLLRVAFCYSDLVKTCSQIDLREKLGIMDPVEQLIHQW